MVVKTCFAFEMFLSPNCRLFTCFTVQSLTWCKYALAETQNSCIWNCSTITAQALFFYNHCFSHQRLKFMAKYVKHSTIELPDGLPLNALIKKIPRKCKLWYFHAGIVIIHSCLMPCSEARQTRYRRNTTLCHGYLTQLQSCRCSLEFWSIIQVSPYIGCPPKEPACRSWQEQQRNLWGHRSRCCECQVFFSCSFLLNISFFISLYRLGILSSRWGHFFSWNRAGFSEPKLLPSSCHLFIVKRQSPVQHRRSLRQVFLSQVLLL